MYDSNYYSHAHHNHNHNSNCMNIGLQSLTNSKWSKANSIIAKMSHGAEVQVSSFSGGVCAWGVQEIFLWCVSVGFD